MQRLDCVCGSRNMSSSTRTTMTCSIWLLDTSRTLNASQIHEQVVNSDASVAIRAVLPQIVRGVRGKSADEHHLSCRCVIRVCQMIGPLLYWVLYLQTCALKSGTPQQHSGVLYARVGNQSAVPVEILDPLGHHAMTCHHSFRATHWHNKIVATLRTRIL